MCGVELELAAVKQPSCWLAVRAVCAVGCAMSPGWWLSDQDRLLADGWLHSIELTLAAVKQPVMGRWAGWLHSG
jgi:hypothetical protein